MSFTQLTLDRIVRKNRKTFVVTSLLFLEPLGAKTSFQFAQRDREERFTIESRYGLR